MKKLRLWGIILIVAGLIVIGIDANVPRQTWTLEMSGAYLLIGSSYFILLFKGKKP